MDTPTGAITLRVGVASIARTCSVLLLAFGVAYPLATAIMPMSGNPYDISNFYRGADGGWDPESNFLQVVLTIALTALASWGLWALLARRRTLARIVVAVAAAGISSAALLTSYARGIESFDQFHFGEQLAPAKAFLEGAIPFTEIYVLHGAGEDIWRPALGFLLFSGGQPSIGAYLLMTWIVRVIATVAFFLLLAWLLRSTTIFLVAAVWFTLSPFAADGGLSYAKNIGLYAAILLIALAFRPGGVRRRSVLLGTAGLLSSLHLLYAVDVGVVMLAMTVGTALVLPATEWDEAGSLRFAAPRLRWDRWLASVCTLAGVVVGQLIAMLVLHVDVWTEFVRLTFIEIPRYQGLTWGFPLPLIDETQAPLWVAVLLMAGLVVALAALIRHDWGSSDRRVAADIILPLILFVGALVYLRFAVGRPDPAHIWASNTLVYVTAFVTLSPLLRRFDLRSPVLAGSVMALSTALVVPVVAAPAWGSLVNGREAITMLRTLRAGPSLPDTTWLTPTQRDVVAYVDENSGPGDTIWVVEPDPLLYYATDRANPTRFFISWFIDPRQFTEETLGDLANDPPEMIILEAGSYFAISDGVPIQDRFPEVMDWIHDEYPERVEVGDAVILTQ